MGSTTNDPRSLRKKRFVGLEALANYANTMSLRKEDNNLFLFAHVKTQPNYAESVKKTQGHFAKAFRDAAAAVKTMETNNENK